MSRNTTAEKDAEPLSDHFATESAYEFNRQIRECLIEAVNNALEQVAPVGRTPEEYHRKLRSHARHTLYGLITMNDIEGYGPDTLNEWLDDQITDRRLPANGGSDEWEMTIAREGWYVWETDEDGYIQIREEEPGLWGFHHDTPESRDTDEWANQFTGTTKQVRKAIESIFAARRLFSPTECVNRRASRSNPGKRLCGDDTAHRDAQQTSVNICQPTLTIRQTM